MVLTIENFRSGLIWKLMQRCPYITGGLRRAGFRDRNEALPASSSALAHSEPPPRFGLLS